MEDYLINISSSFVDTQTGEVISNSNFSVPLSKFSEDDNIYVKYFKCFERGVRLGKSCALSVTVSKDRDIPKVLQTELF